MLARFRETIPTMKSVSSSEIHGINYGFLIEITILPFLTKLDFLGSYKQGKANVMADALSRKSIQTLRALNAHLSLSNNGTVVAELIARPSLLNRVLEAQKKDEKITAVINQIGNVKETEFTVNENGVLYYKDRVCVPDSNDLKKFILEEAHN